MKSQRISRPVGKKECNATRPRGRSLGCPTGRRADTTCKKVALTKPSRTRRGGYGATRFFAITAGMPFQQIQCHFRPPFFFARHPAVTLFLFSLRSLFDGTSRPGKSRESVPGNLVRPAKHCQRAMKRLLDNIRARARSPPNRRRLVREATLLHLCWGVLTTAATSKLFSSQSRCPCKLL